MTDLNYWLVLLLLPASVLVEADCSAVRTNDLNGMTRDEWLPVIIAAVPDRETSRAF